MGDNGTPFCGILTWHSSDLWDHIWQKSLKHNYYIKSSQIFLERKTTSMKFTFLEYKLCNISVSINLQSDDISVLNYLSLLAFFEYDMSMCRHRLKTLVYKNNNSNMCNDFFNFHIHIPRQLQVYVLIKYVKTSSRHKITSIL